MFLLAKVSCFSNVSPEKKLRVFYRFSKEISKITQSAIKSQGYANPFTFIALYTYWMPIIFSYVSIFISSEDV